MRTSSWLATRYSLAFQPPNSLKYFGNGSTVGSGALGFKPIPERADLDSQVSDQEELVILHYEFK